jgi:hypothetical protein
MISSVRSKRRFAALFMTVALLSFSLLTGASRVLAAILPSETAIAGTPNPSAVGTAVTITATITTLGVPISAPATSFVTFQVDGANYATVPLVVGANTASFTTTTSGAGEFAAGSRVITAIFTDPTNTYASSTGSYNQLVKAQPNSLTITSSPAATAVYGTPLSFSTTVTGFGTPTGTVQFSAGTTVLGPPVNLNGSGTGTYTTSTLPVGTYTGGTAIGAVYSGDSFNLSASGTLANLTITAATPNVAVNTSNGTVAYGQSVTFTAAVLNASAGGPNPTGTVTFSTNGGGGETLGSATLSNGVASFTTSGLPSGQGQTITASYASDGNFNGGSSTTTENVGPAPTTTVVTSSQNPSTLGTSVTLTATVSSPAGAPSTGTVTFSDGTTQIGTGTFGAGVWTLSANLGIGTHSITAVFTPAGADLTHSGSTSSALSQQVNPQGSTVTVGSSDLNALFGEDVTFTAQVSDGGAAISGTVQFLNGSSVIGTATVGGTGQVTFSTTSLPITGGTPDQIVAVYSGSSSVTGSTSSSISQAVSASATTLHLNPSPASVTFGQSVTLVAAVSANLPGGGVPTGSVVFSDTFNGSTTTLNGGSQVALDNNGNAILTVPNFAVGTHSIQAVYTPNNGNYTGSNDTQTVTVNPAGTPVTVTSTPNPSVNGQTVQFTVTVEGSASVPTGNITLSDSVNGGAPTPLTIPPADSQLQPTGNPDEAQAIIPYSGLTVGTHNITAAYAASGGNGAGSGSLPGGQTVSPASSSTTLQSSPNPSAFSQPVTLTATVAPASPGVGIPIGSVTFLDTDGVTSLGSSNLVSGTASITTSVLSVGTHSLTAKFVPAGSPASFSASTSPPVSQTVGKAVTTTTLAAAPSPSTFGQSVQFTATVTTTGGGVPDPSSTVTFQDTDGTTLATVSLSAGGTPSTFVASFSTAGLLAATHTITATFSGDNSNAGSSGQTPLVVGAAATTTSLQSSALTSTFGQPLTFSAAVTANSPGGGIPAGSVTFTDTIGGTTSTLGTANLDSNGNATFSTTGTALSAGQHVITANYASTTANDSPSSGSVTQTVNQAASNISLEATPSPSTFGQNVTMTAIVVGTGGVAPSGKVTFTNTLNGTVTTLGTATLASSGTDAQGHPTSTAVLTTSALPAASADNLTASYSGDSSNSGGSTTFAIRVDAASTNTAVKSSLNPSTFGVAVTFTATVTSSAPSGAIPSGSVTFSDTNNGKTTTLGTANADLNGVANFTLSTLSVGVHIITAAYGGSTNFQGSSNTLNQQVFEQQAVITSFSPSYLLVPGTVRDASHSILRVSDSQTLTITGQNFRSDATVYVGGTPLTPASVSADGTTLTVTIPPAAVATAGFTPVQVVNNGTASGTNGAPSATLPVNPAAVITNLPVPSNSARYVRMLSVPYDYTGQNPYDILQEVTLSPVIGDSGYDPDVNLLSALGTSTIDPTDAGYLAFDRWDPTLLRYLTTVPATGQKADDVQLLLGQAAWVVGGVDSQLLGLMKIGAAAGLNPTGIPLVRGWNMVGNPFPTDADLSTLSVLPVQGATLPFYSSTSQPDSAVYEGIVSPIFWSWDGQEYVANHPPQADSPNAPHVLHAYDGYWIYAYEQCTLLVNNAQP